MTGMVNSMTTTILLNAIPAAFVLLGLAIVCWAPARLRRTSDHRVAQVTSYQFPQWEYEERKAA
jgi:hypothetical protein